LYRGSFKCCFSSSMFFGIAIFIIPILSLIIIPIRSICLYHCLYHTYYTITFPPFTNPELYCRRKILFCSPPPLRSSFLYTLQSYFLYLPYL
jgi:hypothetical protein